MNHGITTPASCARRPTVVVLGAGIAGLAAAHELAERGFDVTVYEPRADERPELDPGVPPGTYPPIKLGGLAASQYSKLGTSIAATAELRPFPGRRGSPRRPGRAVAGEHGFRFFPAYYLHIWDLFQRIPVYQRAEQAKGDVCWQPTARTVMDNVRRVITQGATVDGKPSLVFPREAPRSKKVTFAGKVSAQKIRCLEKDHEAPDWVMPLIRRLCTVFTAPLLPPHVYTGTCVVLKLAKLWPVVGLEHEDELRISITAMTIAIYFMVLTKMQRGKMTPELYVDRCGKAVDVAVEMGSGSFNKDAVDDWIKKMNDKGWCRQQDWWDGVPEDVMDVEGQDNGRDDVAEEDDVVGSKRKRRRLLVEDDQTEGDKEGVLLPGLGTMMQDAVDFLSEERTLNYLEWKEEVLGRIKQMEKGKGRMVSVR